MQLQHAAMGLLALIFAQQPFDLHAIKHMQQFFPLLHGLVQECKWQSIPTEWQELLAELARHAARVNTATEVITLLSLLQLLLCMPYVSELFWYTDP